MASFFELVLVIHSSIPQSAPRHIFDLIKVQSMITQSHPRTESAGHFLPHNRIDLLVFVFASYHGCSEIICFS
ncbi:hypothetical protein Y032_0173g416 [Ancylostoma ceylanicum]|uniref:Uncharacterized protein n=1 Tax=Ancylostoma ceylanicum TaxID=53326 RepID=A0A016SV99_9BILA|nr:hypothetical protein Y032_0173g416 [Ancylostoma ceylanicum]